MNKFVVLNLTINQNQKPIKKLLLTFLLLVLVTQTQAQSTCTGGLLLNDDFSATLTSWTQYGSPGTTVVLTATSGCLSAFAAMPATNGGTSGLEQTVALTLNNCYDLCYCYEFPFSGALFNSKLLIAAITPGITPGMLLSGSFTASQAQILDVINSTGSIPATNTCIPTFTATGNFTSIVIINKTTGNVGTDIRIDNICLTQRSCIITPPNPCDTLDAFFSYSVSGNTVNFTDLSTINFFGIPAYSWDFGDPPSGLLNTSTLQNPSHLYPGPGIYFVCLYLSSTSSDGLTFCQDTFCTDVIIPGTVGIEEENAGSLVMSPNPADDKLQFKGSAAAEKITLFNSLGQQVFESPVKNNAADIPRGLAEGVYSVVIETDTGTLHRKLMIKR